MREPGLAEAIRAAGGISELARQIGISQPSVSNWIRVPAERVVSVEAVTGIDRTVLRPDLYGGKKLADDVDEVDVARAQEYALLATFLTRAPDAALLSKLSQLRADASPLGLTHGQSDGRRGQRATVAPAAQNDSRSWHHSGRKVLCTRASGRP